MHNVIFEAKTGSYLYGTNTADSDEDYIGVFTPRLSELIDPFYKCDEINESVVAKLDNGRNSKEAIDKKHYSLHKFIHMAAENNPNIVELFFIPAANITQCTHMGRMLMDHYYLFLHQGAAQRFMGYARAQENKMYVRAATMTSFKQALDILNVGQVDIHLPLSETKLLQRLSSVFGDPKTRRAQDRCFSIGDIHIPENTSVKNAINMLQERVDKASYRKNQVFEQGYDTKFASHLLRLLYEGGRLLETGRLIFPLPSNECDEVMRVKLGEVSAEEFQVVVDNVKARFRYAEQNSCLPSKPNYKEISAMVQGFYGLF